MEALLSVLLVVLSYYYLMSSHPHNAASSTVFPVAKRVLERRPHVAGMAEYRRLQEECARDRSGFWLERARQLLTWQREPTVGLEGDFAAGRVRWFSDGTLNVAYNCVDRHDPERLAIIWEGDEPAHNRRLTYGELGKMTSQMAHWLHSQGVEKGDTVAIYMPMVPEVVVAMLACARIGAMHNVIFAGFSADSLADRIIDSKAKVLITADQGVRGGKILPLKATVDAALNIAGTDRVQKVLVYERTGASVPMRPGRDCLWSVQVAAQPTFFAPVMVEAENPLFMLYTSGSTGRPKGLVHTSAGYLLYAALTMRYSFDYHEGDIFGCLADVGWITGHSYVVYGPLANGATSVLFESTPTYPTASRYWDVVARLRITQLYTAPTVIRALKRFGGAPLDGYDLTSLRVIGTVGEPINPDAWQWYHDKVGGGECAVVDTYWQTETGGHIVAPLPGATPTKAGSATLPCIGISVRVLDQHTGNTPDADVAQGSGSVDGVLAVAAPWPGMARTIFGDHQKFFNTYFAPYPGHYFTGDRVHRDVDGYLWIRGRVDGTHGVVDRTFAHHFPPPSRCHQRLGTSAEHGRNRGGTGQASVVCRGRRAGTSRRYYRVSRPAQPLNAPV